MDIYSLTEQMNTKAEEIINNLEEESIAVYVFLRNEFLKGDVTANPLFQFVYRSFYRLDQAGLTPEFKTAYFQLMELYRNEPTIDPVKIVKELYHYKRRKGDHSIQFSFTTKLINTINPTYLIYDSDVARAFHFSTYYIQDTKKRLKRYLDQQDVIIQSYHRIIEEDLLKKPLLLFDAKFTRYDLPLTKKLDFIFWSYGKLLRQRD